MQYSKMSVVTPFTSNKVTVSQVGTTNIQKMDVNPGEGAKKVSTKTIVIGGLAALGVIGTAVYFGIRGKKNAIAARQQEKLQELVKNGELDEKYLNIFQEIKKLNGEEFIRAAYTKLADAIGLTKTPKLQIENQMGSCSSSLDTIIIRWGGMNSKAEQLRYIRHELEHAKQTELMYRAFGKDTLLEAKVQRLETHARMNPLFCIYQFGKSSFKDVDPKDVRAVMDNSKIQLSEKTGMLDEVLKIKGKILPGTPEYAEASIYLEATKNYISPSMLHGCSYSRGYADDVMRQYMENPVEAIALLEGEKMGVMFEKFLSVVK